MKRCSTCKVEKPLVDFYRLKKSRDGLYSYCKPCSSKRTKDWMARNPGRHLASERKRRERDPAPFREASWRKGGIPCTHDQFLALRDAQHGACAICGCTNGNRELAVDHCHTTNRVRGLLCQTCNRALGGFRDSPDLLLEAAKYLAKSA